MKRGSFFVLRGKAWDLKYGNLKYGTFQPIAFRHRRYPKSVGTINRYGWQNTFAAYSNKSLSFAVKYLCDL